MLGLLIDVVWALFVLGILVLLGSEYGTLILMLLFVYLLFGGSEFC
jgi:hypothetical protein